MGLDWTTSNTVKDELNSFTDLNNAAKSLNRSYIELYLISPSLFLHLVLFVF